LITLTFLSLLASAQASNPLEPALAGQFQCTGPHDAARTCVAIDTYRQLPDGTFSNVTQMRIIGPERAYTFTLVTKAAVKGEAVCTVLRPADVAGGRFRLDGKSLTGVQATMLRAAITKAYANFLNKEACTIFEETQ
jgi:hypothetical protein